MQITAIDLFAGAGGFTTGATQAGVHVAWAANHWPAAVDCHRSNHPATSHHCQDLHQADWSKVPAADIVLASPCCQGHAKARGKDRPHHDASRSTAWAVVSCCEFHRPKAFIVENIPEFLRWSLFGAWRLAMESLGYQLTTTIIDSADAGVPQHRVRMFIVGSLRTINVARPTAPHKPVHAALDFSSGRWSKVSKPGRAEATLRRWENGRREFGRRFVMPYYGSGSGLTGRSIDRPIGTVTTRDRWAVVDGDMMRMLTVAEYSRAMGFPGNYKLPKSRAQAIHLLGNAVSPPVARHLVSQVASQLN
jgi:DNA (cytosine-5)-methyltransferase 1